MTTKNQNSRRRLLKAAAGVGGLYSAGKMLPETWTRPVVDTVTLPAHAQTSGPFYDVFFIPTIASGNSRPGGILDLIVPAAYAQNTVEIHLCLEPAGDMARVDLVAPNESPDGGGVHLSAMAPIGGEPVLFSVEAKGNDCPEPEGLDTLVQVDSLAKGTVFSGEEEFFPFDLTQQACNLPDLASCEAEN